MAIPNHGENSTLVGKAELRALLRSCVDALKDAELHAAHKSLEMRLFDRQSHEVFDLTMVGNRVWSCQFKPMTELVLLEIQSIAVAAPTNGRAAAEHEIEQVLTLAGF